MHISLTQLPVLEARALGSRNPKAFFFFTFVFTEMAVRRFPTSTRFPGLDWHGLIDHQFEAAGADMTYSALLGSALN